MLLVQCPSCKAIMKTDPKVTEKSALSSKKKRCVYCGHTFAIYPQQGNRIIRKIDR